jgi:multidrug efflux system outer membrane protein
MKPRHTLLTWAAALAAAGCTTVGPDYQRPELALPSAHRSADPAPAAPAAGAASFGELAWDSVFPDPDLRELIRTALQQNLDVRVAASRILQAQSQVTIAGAPLLPSVVGSVDAPYSTTTGSDRPSPTSSFQPQAGVGLSWELDFWGRYARSTQAAQAQLLASEQGRYAVMATLVAQVGGAYLTLRALDLTLEISRRTVTTRTQSLDLVQARVDGGVAGILDVRQAENLLYTARKTIPDLQRQIEQQENFINTLLGQNPGPVKRGRPLDQQIAAPALPPGLPTQLLTRRPDIRAAEQQLVAANAQIGVAMALLYPQVTLSGFAGVGSSTISGTNFGPYGVFSLLPAVTLPIFDAGRLQANVDFNEAVAQEAALRYQQTLQQALREVSDALIGVRKQREFREQQELLVKALADASEIATLRYEGGVSSYLEVLDTDRQLFDAERDLVTARRDESAAVIQLYKALGGGWQADAPGAAAAQQPPAAATVLAAVPSRQTAASGSPAR